MSAERQDAQAKKVDTRHEEANGVIEALRQAAVTVRDIGDENIRLEEKCAELDSRIDELEQEMTAVDHWKGIVRAYGELLEDFDRGLYDKDELMREARELDER